MGRAGPKNRHGPLTRASPWHLLVSHQIHKTLTPFRAFPKPASAAMRAVTGAVVSSKPVSIAKAARVLARFAASDILPVKPDTATYVFSAAEAADKLHLFRRDLRRCQPDNIDADTRVEDVEDEGKKSKKKQQRAKEEEKARDVKVEEDNERTVLGCDLHGFAAEQDIVGEKKGKKKKRAKEEEEARNVQEEERTANVLGFATEVEIAYETKRRKKRETEDEKDNKEQVEHTKKKRRK